MAGRVARFFALPANERGVLLRALALLPLVAVQLRLRGLETVSRHSRVRATRESNAPDPRATARLVGIAARHGLHAGNCLSQSLTLKHLLDSHGVASELRIGARRAGAGLEAHAWIEHDGRPLNDSPDIAQRFPPFQGLQSALPPLV